ncbi:uncharacterized protein BDCG_04611 [Blastomyces dermatitidis ER-3]|uniref:Vegetative cell wall protein gp1 n=3 Tax=Blastomyces TaxID=229219 RepID=A0A179UB37_BLAGS|nr:uncharacterized protein BDBG_01596 [Blastomyces gilchristii SLH14081]XP_045280947.1 uncharacterized protein BDCG_04611 [Blastomyces dermatitidis ER-3]EGE87030.2 vegetative cell wall protein gp1 [Blastomyces dermatitidis ATCC 18188]OAT01220.1 hypothetical protein BDCG_04611 [Blastomyces dermatitidis ER-3]OAT05164.1 hypothetical protein BDBG_01596 [Blastomyces gilchristii SLH14081]
MYQYPPQPPHGWSTYDYATTSPPQYPYYPSNYASPHVSPRTKRHSHRASYSAAKEPSSGWHSMPPGYGSYYDSVHGYSSPPRKHENSFYYNQIPVYDEADSPKRSRARRASTSARTPQKPKPSTAAGASKHAKATEADAIRMGIPEGYSIKNWDPNEEPILLLGSVFDANSLGKWIYDWTVFHHGASAPMADVAGDLWLLLIKLAGKVKRAQECGPRIRNTEAREMVEDFLESGERLWHRFEKLLKACEHFMWKAAKRESGKGGPVMMGRNAGCEFVDSIFGRDRELENTEKLMNSIRLWDMRFDANCDEILRRPTAF